MTTYNITEQNSESSTEEAPATSNQTEVPTSDQTEVPTSDLTRMEETFRLFAPTEGEFVEVVILSKDEAPVHGFFDRNGLYEILPELAEYGTEGIYIRPNPVGIPKTRNTNVLEVVAKGTFATEQDILRRSWLLIDFDPGRPRDTASTEDELSDAWAKLVEVRQFLATHGFSNPVSAISGNGAHLLIPLHDVSIDVNGSRICADFIRTLNTAFSGTQTPHGTHVEIDRVTHDPPRLVRFYGTVNRKGESTCRRPHRLSYIVDLPETVYTVTLSHLKDVIQALDPSAFETEKSTARTMDRTSSSSDPHGFDYETELIKDALHYIDPSSYETWLQVGMALHSRDADGDMELWNDWSRGIADKPCDAYEEGACERKWTTFTGHRDSGVSLGTLFHIASHNGWSRKAASARINGRKGGRPLIHASTPAILAHNFIEGISNDDGWPLYRHWSGSWYRYDGRSYDKMETEDLEGRVMGFLQAEEEEAHANEGKWSKVRFADSKTCRDVVANLKSDRCLGLPASRVPPFWITDDDHERADGWIPMANYTVNILNVAHCMNGEKTADTDSIRHNSPALFNTLALPYEYTDRAECPLWKKYLETTQPDPEDRKVLQMLAGLSLVEMTDYQVFFILLGLPGAGKSVFLDVLRALVGNDNVCCVPLTDLGKRFNTRLLTENLLNIIDDMPIQNENSSLRDIEGLLKTITTGGLVPCELKYQNRSQDRPAIARTVMAANTLPHVFDRSDAVWDRMRIISFDQRIRGTEQEVLRLQDKIIETELSGVFMWAVEGLAMLLKHRTFPEHSRGLQLKTDHRTACNPVALFINERYPSYSARPDKILASVFYQHYRNWCKENGYSPVSKHRFTEELRMLEGVVLQATQIELEAGHPVTTWYYIFPTRA